MIEGDTMPTRRPSTPIQEEGRVADAKDASHKRDWDPTGDITMAIAAIIIAPFYFNYLAIKGLWNNL
jgi:hypothetical protein